eukprot:9483853-Pyramimonas_sp.AAC.1
MIIFIRPRRARTLTSTPRLGSDETARKPYGSSWRGSEPTGCTPARPWARVTFGARPPEAPWGRPNIQAARARRLVL